LRASAPQLHDLRRIAAELIAALRSTGKRELARVVVDDAEIMLTVTAVRRGAGIAERSASYAAVLTPIVGRIRLATGNGSTDLTPARFMSLPRGSSYEILADDEAAFMLVVAKHRTAASGHA
jgi:homogentisate 1,2-dioxygenase